VLLYAPKPVCGWGIIFDSQFETNSVIGQTVQQELRDASPRSVSSLEKAAQSIQSSNYPEAISSLKQLLGQRPRDRMGWYLLGLAYYGDKRIDEAIQAASRCCEVSKDWPQGQWLKGTFLAVRGNVLAAREAFDAGIRAMPESPGGYLQRAKFLVEYAHQNRRDLALAISDLETMLRLGGPKITAHGYLGIVYRKLKQDDNAEQQFLKVLALDPHQLDAIERLTRLYDDLGQHAKADLLLNQVRADLQRLDSSRFKQVEGYHALALARRAQLEGADDERIEEHFRAAITHVPSNSYWRLEFAQWLDAHRRAVDAIPILDAGLELDGNNPDLAAGLAWLLADTATDLSRARKLVALAGQKEAMRPYIADTKAWIEYRSGDFHAAWREISPSMKLARDVPDIAYHAGAIQARLGNRTRALEFLEVCLSSETTFHRLEEARELHARLKAMKFQEEKTAPARSH
jgi:tetratricopeptide (TPR) repeat protein